MFTSVERKHTRTMDESRALQNSSNRISQGTDASTKKMETSVVGVRGIPYTIHDARINRWW